MKIAVVGAGVAGLSAARSIAERGHTVTLFEQHPLFHSLGSSHGNSRIVRKAYPDAFYTEMMLEGYPMWHELQQHSDEPLLFECGLLYFGSGASAKVQSVEQGLRDLAVPFEGVDHRSVPRVFPDLRLQPGEIGIFTPEAGWVHAERVLRTTWRLAVAAGATLRTHKVDDVEQLEKEFDGAVVCAGGWIKDFVDLPVTVTLQTFAYLEVEQKGPVWIENSELNMYGFPSEEGCRSIKAGVHRLGPEVDPHGGNRTPSPSDVESLRQMARTRFGAEEAKAIASQGCLYTSTSDEDFRWGRTGKRSYYISACSGHGFKFGPWLGKMAADFVEGKRSPEEVPRFSRTT